VLLATAVLPDGGVKSVKNDAAGLVKGGVVTDTVASDNVTPTIAVEYFLKPTISIETIAGITAHHVTISAGAGKGLGAVDNVLIVPSTVTAKYHLPLGHGIKPYVGVGPSLFIIVADDPSATVKSLGVTRTKLSSELGVAVQGGVDIAINKHYGFSLDAKKYWVGTTAHFWAGNTEVLATRHKLDPWVLSGGVTYRF
jgi:outer membrane protein